MSRSVTLSQWGNSLSIRLPHEVLNKMGLTKGDKLNYDVEGSKIVLEPAPKKSTLAKMFEGYDSSQPYPNEIVDKGGAIGEELA